MEAPEGQNIVVKFDVDGVEQSGGGWTVYQTGVTGAVVTNDAPGKYTMTFPDTLAEGSYTVQMIFENAPGCQTVLENVIKVLPAVSPNCDPRVIVATKTAGMQSWPGVLTPTECFAALKNGADGLKIFPGSLLGVEGLRAIRAVLPAGTQVYAVGGAGPDNFGDWFAASADGFGIGSALYKPGMTLADISARADNIVAAYDAARP